MPRRAKYETQLKRNEEAVPTEPQPETTRVFKTHTGKDGSQTVEEEAVLTEDEMASPPKAEFPVDGTDQVAGTVLNVPLSTRL